MIDYKEFMLVLNLMCIRIFFFLFELIDILKVEMNILLIFG